jgi:hypothetical protein
MLRHPYWLDEAWVADSIRAPLSDVVRLSASTPPLFTLLLRPARVFGAQAPRLIPLAFAGGAVVLAVLLAASLAWPRRSFRLLACTGAGLVALLAPTALARDDLKQYTADAFCALAALLLCSRLDAEWSRKRLIVLSVLAGVGPILSVAAAFSGFACLAALLLTRLVRRAHMQAVESGVALVASLAFAIGVYSITYEPHVTPQYYVFWRAFFLRGSPGEILTTVWDRLEAQSHMTGLGAVGWFVVLLVLGLVTMVWLKRPTVALGFVGLWAEMVLLGTLRRYPFLDLRTSHFLLLSTGVVGAIGAAGVCAAVGMRWPRQAIALGLLATLVWLVAVSHPIRRLALPNEDVESQTSYVARHRSPGDVVLVNYAGSYGFAYYWPADSPDFIDMATAGPGFIPAFTSRSDIVVAQQRTPDAVRSALADAVTKARAGSGKIWFVRSHVTKSENAAFADAVSTLGLSIRAVCVHPSTAGHCRDKETLATIDGSQR